MVTEFARDFLKQRGVKVNIPGEKERVVVSLSEETTETDKQTEEKNGTKEPECTATVGETCEVGKADFQCISRFHCWKCQRIPPQRFNE